MTIINQLRNNQSIIVSRYNSGDSCRQISKDYNCNSGTIYCFLRDDVGITMHKGRKEYGKTEKNKDQIIQWFNDGCSIKEIARRLDMKHTSISIKMKKWGLNTTRYSTARTDKLIDHLDEIVQLYNNGITMTKLAAKYNTNAGMISEMFKNKGIKARPTNKYTCNYSFFKKINTPEKAYFLGWMYSDGNVSTRGINRIQIIDKDILIKLNKLLINTTPIKKVAPPKKYPHRKIQYILSFHSVKMSQDLIKLGCFPNKSLTLQFPTEDQVPKEFIPHFIRGYFDGDGSIYYVKDHNVPQVSIVSTLSFMNKFIEYTQLSKVDISTRFPERLNSTRQARITRKDDIIKFINYIYKDSTIHLDRKYQIAKPFLSL